MNASRASHSLCELNGLIAIGALMASVSKTTTATCIKTTTKRSDPLACSPTLPGSGPGKRPAGRGFYGSGGQEKVNGF